jgi:hypothetical protein
MAKHVGVDTVRGAQALYVANLMVTWLDTASGMSALRRIVRESCDSRSYPSALQVNVATEDPDTWAAAREVGREFLAQANGDSAFDLYAIGHCHIDTGELTPSRSRLILC